MSKSLKLLSHRKMHMGVHCAVIRNFYLYDTFCAVHLDIPMRFSVFSIMCTLIYCSTSVACLETLDLLQMSSTSVGFESELCSQDNSTLYAWVRII